MDSARSKQHSPHPSPQVLEGDGTVVEDKQNEDSDMEMEMEDDSHQPLRDMSKRARR